MNQMGAPSLSRRRDQGIGKGQPLLHSTTDIKRNERYSFIDRDDFIEELQVVFHSATSLSLRGPELSQSPGKFGE